MEERIAVFIMMIKFFGIMTIAFTLVVGVALGIMEIDERTSKKSNE